MKRYVPFVTLLIIALFFSTTGFQCGSAETTSAKLYMQQKQWEKAEASLLKEIQKNDKNEEAWFLLGQTRLELRNYTGMLDAYNRAAALSDVHKNDINRNRLAVWAQLYNEGVKYYNLGRDSAGAYDRALQDFNTAIKMQPDSAGTYYVTALVNYAKKDLKTAQTNLETALQKKPDFGDAAKFLGQIYYQDASETKDSTVAKNDYMRAAAAFKIAYDAEPSKPENITNLIDAYERSNQTAKALELTRNAVTENPNDKVFRYAYGVFLLKQEKFPDAVEEFKKAIEIDPEYSDAIYNLGVSYLNWGVALKNETSQKEEAAKKNVKGGKTPKEDRSYMEKFSAALPYLEKSAQLRPDDAALWQQLGRLYAILNQPAKSKDAFQKYDELVKAK